MECAMNFETEKAWMVRLDGTAFPCVCHIYGSPDDIEETLYAAQWLFEHTAEDTTKELCLRFFKTYGVSLSEHRNCVRSILLKIKETRYRFLDYNFIFEIAGEIQNAAAGDLAKLNEQVNHALNNEFMRVRYGGMYDWEKEENKSRLEKVWGSEYSLQFIEWEKRNLYFLLSNDEPKWRKVIVQIVKEHKTEIYDFQVISDEKCANEFRVFFHTKNGIT